LSQADPIERNRLEHGRAQLTEALNIAQAEQVKKYPEPLPESEQTRRRVLHAKIEAGYRAFSDAAYEYSKIMDMFVGQAPEYVGLAWGAIKLVLLAQVNHTELKQNVKEHMERIKSKFEMIDHLTAYMPKKNLVASVTKAYELFSRFLAKSIKFYTRNTFSRLRARASSSVRTNRAA